jgi:5-methylcytosine-specific restriction endonuclease McrA
MNEPIARLSSAQLLARVRELVQRSNGLEADLLAHLAEVDARQLYLEEGCSSMFTWCQRVLHFAEGVAYKRIQAARAVRRHPELIEVLRRGDLHLTAVSLLAPKLTSNNCTELIRAARHRSAEEVRQLLADLDPRPAPPNFVRRIPEPAKQLPATMPLASPQATPVPRERTTPLTKGVSEPLGAQRYRVQFVADRELYEQIQELRALMRHQVPDGDLGKILSRAVKTLLDRVRKQKFAETSATSLQVTSKPKPSRHIPAAIRRSVWQRDGGRCTYISSSTKRRCGSRDFVEYDHVEAWARTRAHSIEGITLRCRAHNQQRAREDFGREHIAQFGRRTGSESSSP